MKVFHPNHQVLCYLYNRHVIMGIILEVLDSKILVKTSTNQIWITKAEICYWLDLFNIKKDGIKSFIL